MFASKARCGPIPLRLAYGALRGNGPALAEEALGRMRFSRCARGDFGVRLQGSLRTDPASLGRVLALRGIGPALAEEALGRMGLSRCARGVLVFASKARSGPIPLRLAYGALRGNGPVLAEEALARMGFSRCARGGGIILLGRGTTRVLDARIGRTMVMNCLKTLGLGDCRLGDHGCHPCRPTDLRRRTPKWLAKSKRGDG